MASPRILSAQQLMTSAHAGQMRKDGRPYATHPAAVMQILRDELGVADEDTLVAALLHDVVEDTPTTVDDIARQFGTHVALMVQTLSKSPAPGETKEVMLARYYASLQLADDATRQIKLADRIHNLREMSAATSAFRVKYFIETRHLIDVVLNETPGLAVLVAEYNRCVARYPDDASKAGVAD